MPTDAQRAQIIVGGERQGMVTPRGVYSVSEGAGGLPLWPTVGASTAGLRSAWAAAISASSTASAACARSCAAEEGRSGTGTSAAAGERGSAWLKARVTPSRAAVNSLGITQNVLLSPLASWGSICRY